MKKAIAGVAAAAVFAATGLYLGGDSVLANLRQLEKQELTVYADKLAYGIPTVCSGFTDWSLKVGQVYTKADCDRIDRATAEKYGLAILNCTKAKLNQNQFDALTLFAINVGIGGACGSRAVRLMNQGLSGPACRAIANGPMGSQPPKPCRNSKICMRVAAQYGAPAWSYSGGAYRRGLYNRRQFEAALCMKPVSAPAAKESA